MSETEYYFCEDCYSDHIGQPVLQTVNEDDCLIDNGDLICIDCKSDNISSGTYTFYKSTKILHEDKVPKKYWFEDNGGVIIDERTLEDVE